jgi:3-deoxy-manno-octulosonate cytidylyltransferase (CMP-KDO synthetase)
VHPINDVADAISPNVVKCVLNERGEAMYFSRAPVPYDRDGWRLGISNIQPDLPIFRHIGLYAYRAKFLRAFPQLAVPAVERFESLEQLRALAHGYRIAVLQVNEPLPPGIDTPQDYERLKARFASA